MDAIGHLQVNSAKWALGCYTGAALKPFKSSDMPTGKKQALGAIKLLWAKGLIRRAEPAAAASSSWF